MCSAEYSLSGRQGVGKGPKQPATAAGVKVRRRGVAALLLLASLLSISKLPTSPICFVPATHTHRVSRLNRIGEVSSEQAGDQVVAAQLASDRRPKSVAVAPLRVKLDIPSAALILSRLSSQFRSPPFFRVAVN
jgi:hypothetical protein